MGKGAMCYALLFASLWTAKGMRCIEELGGEEGVCDSGEKFSGLHPQLGGLGADGVEVSFSGRAECCVKSESGHHLIKGCFPRSICDILSSVGGMGECQKGICVCNDSDLCNSSSVPTPLLFINLLLVSLSVLAY